MSRQEMCFIWSNEAMGPTGLFIPSGSEMYLPQKALFFVHLFLYQKSQSFSGGGKNHCEVFL